MTPITFGVSVLLLATLVEGFTEYLFGEVQSAKPYLRYIALALGVGVSLAYGIDILGILGLVSPFPLVGQIISGLILGRGSNYVNDIMTSFTKGTPSA